jgi:D-amino-acid dehydrogenase
MVDPARAALGTNAAWVEDARRQRTGLNGGAGMLQSDVIVLGAGIVGVSAALHVQKRGRTVTLVDRRGVAEETSYGNGGIIQREGVVPYTFPRDLSLIAKYAANLLPEAHVHYHALPLLAPWLVRYWAAGAPARKAATARAMRPLVERCILEHEELMGEAGALGFVRRTGYLRVFRSGDTLAAALAKDRADREAFGVRFQPIDSAKLALLEPHLKPAATGAILMPDPVSVSDPAAVCRAYAKLFELREGTIRRGEARTLTRRGAVYQVETEHGPAAARAVVVALGPWSDAVFRALGYRLPFAVKRGYHMHYRAEGNATLSRPVVDAENGFALTAMAQGIRLTTGAEFALRDAPPTPVQLTKVEPLAREIFPIAERLEARPWLGRRPCLPDMVPVIGQAPRHAGVWFDFGHHHLGFTLGPVSGRLLAELMAGEEPFTDPAPYRPERFG